MTQIVNTNLNASRAQRELAGSAGAIYSALQRLSSGLRINSAADDAAGLAISDRMYSQLKGMNQAARNANEAISMAQIADGTLGNASGMMQRLRELAVQSANGTNSSTDRAALQKEASQLVQELDRLATSTEFNGQQLLNGSLGSQQFQVGANAGQTIATTLDNFRTAALGHYQNTGQSSSGSVNNLWPQNVTSAGTVTLSSAAGTGTAVIGAGSSARVIANNINQQAAKSGVVAKAETDAVLAFSGAGTFTFGFTVAGGSEQQVTFSVSGSSGADAFTSAISSLNAALSPLGVEASFLNASAWSSASPFVIGADGIQLKSSQGDDIGIVRKAGVTYSTMMSIWRLDRGGGNFFNTTALLPGTFGIDNTWAVNGFVNLDSDKAFTVSSSSNAFDTTGANANGSLQAVAAIDLRTVAGAKQALAVIDSGLAAVDSQRATLGALQSRFESARSDLHSSSDNLAASRSRIVDADYAQETANLSRAQILQNAGTAMLAQANQYPQSVLALLKA